MLIQKHLHPSYLTVTSRGEQHALSQANVTWITLQKLASFPSGAMLVDKNFVAKNNETSQSATERHSICRCQRLNND